MIDAKIGQLRTIQSFVSHYNTDANHIRNTADIGGGGGSMNDSSRSRQLRETSADA
jgi:hypothetical protein